MAGPKRRRRLTAITAIAVTCVAGPAVTVLAGLGGITSFAALMDLHGFTVTMRFAVVGAVAVVVIPAGIFVATFLCDRIEAKAHRARLTALSRPQAASANPTSSPARHRRVA